MLRLCYDLHCSNRYAPPGDRGRGAPTFNHHLIGYARLETTLLLPCYQRDCIGLYHGGRAGHMAALQLD